MSLNQDLLVKDFTKQDTKAGLILIAMWEFFGTALFTYGIVASGGWGPYVSCSLFISILILSNWTGGHVNPAVSLGFLVNGNITVPEFLAYIIGQGSGALVGAIAAAALLDIISCPWVPLEQVDWVFRDILGEAFGTFTFVLTILIACDPDTSYTKNNKLFTYTAIAIGLHYSRGFATRTGALNPAVAVMTEIVQSLVDLNYKYLINFYIFLIGPFGGGFLAGLFFKKVWKPQFLSQS